MEKAEKILIRIEKTIGSFLLFSILCLLTTSVVSRYILRSPIIQSDELSTLLFCLMTFLGFSCAVSERAELIVNVLYEKYPQFRKIMDVLLHSARLILGMTILWSGYKYVMVEYDLATLTPLCQIPTYYVALLVPIFGLLLGVKSIFPLLKILRGE